MKNLKIIFVLALISLCSVLFTSCELEPAVWTLVAENITDKEVIILVGSGPNDVAEESMGIMQPGEIVEFSSHLFEFNTLYYFSAKSTDDGSLVDDAFATVFDAPDFFWIIE